MKSTFLYFLMFVLTLSVNGSCQYTSRNSDRPASAPTKESRTVNTFTAIDLSISANIILKQGSPQSIELQGESEDLEKVLTEVSGEVLKIKSRPGSWNMKRIDIYITVQDIKGLTISGSGNIKAETGIHADELSLIISGSGNIQIADLSVKQISSVISGSGNIAYGGKESAQESKLVVTGSGNINAQDLSTAAAQVTITGSGDCQVNASDKLDVQVTGSGSVQYKGKALVNAQVTGSGKVRSF